MPQDSVQSTAAHPAASPVVVHEDTTAKWFLISSVMYFVIVGIIAVTIAAKFVLTGISCDVTLHVNIYP